MINLVKASSLITARWAGGTTTQLAIRPRTAEYQKFNFDFRVSFATVEIEESTFTHMPGVTRHLMILEGELDIDHIDRYQKHLTKFSLDTFNGEWPTKARGKVKDFNLMTRGNYSGMIEAHTSLKGEIKSIGQNEIYSGLYLLKGSATCSVDSTPIIVHEGDYLELENEKGTCTVLASTDVEFIVAKVYSSLI